MAAITDYTDVVTLPDVKLYLRLDDQGTTLDDELTGMINAGCRLVEQYTNYVMKPKSKTYFAQDGCVNIYDFPIRAITDPADTADYTSVDKGLYTRIQLNAYETSSVGADVGYTETEDVEPLLVLAVKETIRVWFYNAESDTQTGILSSSAKNMLDPIKRFVF
jgi:hypothetical protein